MFDRLNAISENGRPKITGTKDILGSIQTWEVTTSSSTMIAIKDFLILNVGEAME